MALVSQRIGVRLLQQSVPGVLLPALLAVLVEVKDREIVVLAQKAETAGDFLIGLLDAAEILPETILVELLVGLHVPQAAAVGES